MRLSNVERSDNWVATEYNITDSVWLKGDNYSRAIHDCLEITMGNNECPITAKSDVATPDSLIKTVSIII